MCGPPVCVFDGPAGTLNRQPICSARVRTIARIDSMHRLLRFPLAARCLHALVSAGLLILLWFVLCSGAWAQSQTARRVAFVVGNAAYQNETRLTNPHNDASLLARTLRDDLRFDEVIERRDLTRRQMVDLVREVRQKGSGADAIFVYFSGHGMQGPNGNYLIPVDARIDNEDHLSSEGINARDIVEALRTASPRVAVLVLDACRDSPYSRRTRSAAKGLSRMNVSGGNLLVAYATDAGTTADDGAPGNSPYARALAQHLRQTNQPLLAQFDAVRRATLQFTGNRQSPTREGDLEVSVHLTNPFGAVTPANRDQIEDEAWALCRGAATGVPCEDYLSGWPQGRYVALARTRLRELQALARPPAAQPAPAPAAAPVPAPAVATGRSPGEVFKDCDVCPEMVVIPGGSFMMGSPVSELRRFAHEGPQRRVAVGSFLLGRTEVTQGQWRAVMGSNPSNFSKCGDDCPVENVSWNDAQAYVKKLSERSGKAYRLPSEAEWEYAARANSTTRWSFGDDASRLDDHAWFRENSAVKSHPVAGKQANGFGLFDMHGNVWEWVQDCYDEKAYAGQAPNDGRAYEVAGCSTRVMRGGSWRSYPHGVRSAERHRFTPDLRNVDIGVRLARMLP